MDNIEIKIATGIETDKFYSIIEHLKDSNWKLVAEYWQFDKGIDFDLYQFTKNGEDIILAWDNWLEGEIKAEAKTLDEIAKNFGLSLKFGGPAYLNNPNFIIENQNSLRRNL